MLENDEIVDQNLIRLYWAEKKKRNDEILLVPTRFTENLIFTAGVFSSDRTFRAEDENWNLRDLFASRLFLRFPFPEGMFC